MNNPPIAHLIRYKYQIPLEYMGSCLRSLSGLLRMPKCKPPHIYTEIISQLQQGFGALERSERNLTIHFFKGGGNRDPPSRQSFLKTLSTRQID